LLSPAKVAKIALAEKNNPDPIKVAAHNAYRDVDRGLVQ